MAELSPPPKNKQPTKKNRLIGWNSRSGGVAGGEFGVTGDVLGDETEEQSSATGTSRSPLGGFVPTQPALAFLSLKPRAGSPWGDQIFDARTPKSLIFPRKKPNKLKKIKIKSQELLAGPAPIKITSGTL